MDFQAILALSLGIMVLAMKPGPGMLAVASRALDGGMPAVLAFVTGTNMVKILFFTIAFFGISVAEDHLLFFSVLVKALAAVYLIWMGGRGLMTAKIPPELAALETQKSGGKRDYSQLLRNFSAGFMLTLSNPFDILFFAGILPTIVNLKLLGLADFGIGVATIIVSDLIIAFSYAIPLAMSRNLFSPKILRRLNIGSNIAIIFVGLVIGMSALPMCFF